MNCKFCMPDDPVLWINKVSKISTLVPRSSQSFTDVIQDSFLAIPVFKFDSIQLWLPLSDNDPSLRMMSTVGFLSIRLARLLSEYTGYLCMGMLNNGTPGTFRRD